MCRTFLFKAVGNQLYLNAEFILELFSLTVSALDYCLSLQCENNQGRTC